MRLSSTIGNKTKAAAGSKRDKMLQDFLQKHDFIEVCGEPFIIDMMYAKDENIALRPAYQEIGFGNRALVHVDLAACLQQLAPRLVSEGMKLRIRDAYRPPLAHQLLVRSVPVEGLFASVPQRSLHCYGTAIDCCLTDEKGRNLLFPTEIDAYDIKYARQLARGETAAYYKHLQKARQDFYTSEFAVAINNRELLKKMMTEVGFETIGSEWWHYQLPLGRENYPMVDWSLADWD